MPVREGPVGPVIVSHYLGRVYSDLERIQGPDDISRRVPEAAARLLRLSDAVLGDVLRALLYAAHIGDPQKRRPRKRGSLGAARIRSGSGQRRPAASDGVAVSGGPRASGSALVRRGGAARPRFRHRRPPPAADHDRPASGGGAARNLRAGRPGRLRRALQPLRPHRSRDGRDRRSGGRRPPPAGGARRVSR